MISRSVSFNLEPTFRCNLLCDMCPRFSSEDPHLDMSEEVYDRICESMEVAHTVDFTGWGEPLLHPRIFEMLKKAKGRGVDTTMTSNGTTLNDRNCRALVASELDYLRISMDGMSPETFDPIRAGASFLKVTENIGRLSSLISEENSPLQLAIAFTIQEHNASDLPAILPWMESVGVREVHLKHLNVLSNPEDWKRSFLKYRLGNSGFGDEALLKLERSVQDLRDGASQSGMELRIHSEFPMTTELKGRHCLATPLESLYFSYDGKVSPCCHFGHTVSRYFQGDFFPPESLFFGDVRTQSLESIWENSQYQAFRGGFETEEFPEACQTCYLLYGK